MFRMLSKQHHTEKKRRRRPGRRKKRYFTIKKFQVYNRKCTTHKNGHISYDGWYPVGPSYERREDGHT